MRNQARSSGAGTEPPSAPAVACPEAAARAEGRASVRVRPPRWSERTAWDRHPSRLAELLTEAKARGQPVVDLTESNPTRCGLRAEPSLLGALADPASAHYRPDPRGMHAAREAVAGLYRARGLRADAERMVLTTSTSEAYGWLFKLLADPGEELLVPRPSYPLLPMLARLDGVRLRPYDLVHDDGWRIDVDALRSLVGPATRGVVVVHPNNPTGTLVHRSDAQDLERLARDRGLGLIVDEVFGDFLHRPPAPDRLESFAALEGACCFVLGGLSKLALLPQLKLGWIACHGPDEQVSEALERLELIGDSYLSVSTPVQVALPSILRDTAALRRAARERILCNLDTVDAEIRRAGDSCPVRRLALDGGWYVMLEIPRTRSDDEWLERLVREHGVVAHPGYLYGLPDAGSVVVGLLLEPERFAPAFRSALSCWAAG